MGQKWAKIEQGRTWDRSEGRVRARSDACGVLCQITKQPVEIDSKVTSNSGLVVYFGQLGVNQWYIRGQLGVKYGGTYRRG